MNAQPDVSNLAFTPNKKEHGRRRRIIGHGFSEAAVRDSNSIIMKHIRVFCNKLINSDVVSKFRNEGEQWTEPIDVTDLTFWVSQDITTDLVFGKSYNLLEDNTMRSTGAALQGGLRRNSLCFQYPSLFRPGINHRLDFGTWFIPSVLDKVMGFMAAGAKSALERIQAEESSGKESRRRDDVLSHLIHGIDPETGTNFTTEDVIMEAGILTLAGGDTIGTALQIILFYLSRNAKAYENLAQEIRLTFSSSDDISLGPQLDACKYLHAVIDESLRMFGAAAFWRDAGPGGALVCGIYISEGLTVGTSPYAISRHEAYFRNAFKFDPERWIPGGEYTDDEIQTARAAYRPFGLGPRSCIAMTFARSVILLTTASVIWSMDFRSARDAEKMLSAHGKRYAGLRSEGEDEFQLYGSFTLACDGPVLEFKARK